MNGLENEAGGHQVSPLGVILQLRICSIKVKIEIGSYNSDLSGVWKKGRGDDVMCVL